MGVLNWTPLFLPHERSVNNVHFLRSIKYFTPSSRRVTALCTFAAAGVSRCPVLSDCKPSPAPPDNIVSLLCTFAAVEYSCR